MSTHESPSSTAAHVDVTAASFEREVLQRSRELPVLVDFWATWCAPCRTLGPILEKLARELAGRFVLAKVDIDANPELAELARIQSVPTALLFVDGRPVDGFMGAQPESAVRGFLEPHLGAAQQPVLERVGELEQAGRREEAVAVLREHLRGQSDDGAARVELVRILLELGKQEDARLVGDKLTPQDWESDAGQALRARMELAKGAGDLAQLAAQLKATPADIEARLAYGKALIAAGQREQGLEQLLQAAQQDLHHDGDAPRKALIEAFTALGWEDPLTLEYQRRLSMLLTA
jgi:putative thioredoxin